MKKQTSNPFWGAGETKDFGKVAIEYAAGEDVILDQQLVQYECLVNQAHVVMLFKQGLITKKVAKSQGHPDRRVDHPLRLPGQTSPGLSASGGGVPHQALYTQRTARNCAAAAAQSGGGWRRALRARLPPGR